jgi:hypothetical protein
MYLKYVRYVYSDSFIHSKMNQFFFSIYASTLRDYTRQDWLVWLSGINAIRFPTV